MHNFYCWILSLLVDFGFLLLLFKYHKHIGVIAFIIANTIISNLQVNLLVDMGLTTLTLGNVAYGSLFLANDILCESGQERLAKQAVSLCFIIFVMFSISVLITNLYIPSQFDETFTAFGTLLNKTPRILIASCIAFIVSQRIGVELFLWMKKNTRHPLWIRNNFSTNIAQGIDTLIFVTIAFWGVYSDAVFIDILWTTYAIKAVVGVLDTPFLYLGRQIWRKEKTNQINLPGSALV